MVYGIAVIFLLTFLTELFLKTSVGWLASEDKQRIRQLYWWHLLFVGVYYLYAQNNASDSIAYYHYVKDSPWDTWLSYYGLGTRFVHFVSFPLIKIFGFSYEACMVFFGYLGFIGWSLAYSTFLERTEFKHHINLAGFKINLLTLIIFLPNNHFWSASFGKGALIILGMGLVLYGLSQPQKRIWMLAVGAVMVYHVRPHILYAIVLSAAVGLVFSQRGLPSIYRWTLGLIAVAAIVYLFYDLQTLPQFEQFFASDRDAAENLAQELGKSGSGVDINAMSLPGQVFTFLYRPLFFDAHTTLALYTSVENLIYLVLTLHLFRRDFIRFLFKRDYMVITAFLTFLTVATILAQISGNLGIAIRQKSQVFFLLFFVLLLYKDYRGKKYVHQLDYENPNQGSQL
jgi:hypothetical protein